MDIVLLCEMREDTLLSKPITRARTGSELCCVCCRGKCNTDDLLGSALQDYKASKDLKCFRL